MPPSSAYLHVPFCRHRCGYCNFAVVAGRDDLAEDYLDALATELSWLGHPRPVRTLYLGGGTPTRLAAENLRTLLKLAREWFPPESDDLSHGEWTVEANPGDLTEETIRILSDHGVTRLSLGVQSFRADKLLRLERDHTPEDARRCIEQAQQAGLEANIDLIFAAPHETLEQWSEDLGQALRLEPEHVSTYGLTYEKGTTFWSRRNRGDLVELDEVRQRRMYETAIDLLTDHGMEHYEVSNFALPGRRSRHNETYWSGREWFAAGPGAARYLNGVRETNHASTTTWMRRIRAGESPVAESERLTAEQRAHERLVFGLRRLEGIRRKDFALETGYTLEDLVGDKIDRLVELGMLADTGGAVRLTREGLMVSDSLWPELL